MPRGKFIVFEGVCQAGKTTAAHRLVREIQALGLPALYNHGACTYTDLGRHFHRLTEEMSVPFSTAFYLADLVQDTIQRVRPWLDEGRFVIQDRYSDSIIAYRKAWGRLTGEELDARPVVALYEELGLLAVPDVRVWFQAPREVLLDRLAGGADTSVHRLYLRDPAFLDLVQDELRQLTEGHPGALTISTAGPEAGPCPAEDILRVMRSRRFLPETWGPPTGDEGG